MTAKPTAKKNNPRAGQEKLAAALMERINRDYGSRLLTWSVLNRPSLRPGGLFDLERHPYLIDLYGSDDQVLVLYKASQMGASEYAVSYVLHAADERMATVLYLFPTDTHVSDFSSARIGPAIEASQYLESIVVEGGAIGGKRGADRVTLKRVRDRFIYLRGAQVKPNGQAPQLKSVDADVIVLDEVDEMDPRAPAIAEKRLGHSQIAEQRWISTPTYPGMGIHAKWLESDQREWHIKCEHCGCWQAMTINQVVEAWDDLGRPVRSHDFVACMRCGKPLNRLARGEWIAAFPTRNIAGFHLSKLFSPTADLLALAKGLETTDETKRREAYNQDLGEPYTPRGGQITDEVLANCKREYALKPVSGERTVMGVDVNKLLNVVIRGPQDKETGERPLRYAGEVESFEALGNLVRKYHVWRGVIDALPETRKVREFQAAFPGRIYIAYYVAQKTGTKKTEPAQWDLEEGVVNLDRTRTLDTTFARFYEQENSLPANVREIRDYYAHLKASVRTVDKQANGQPVAQYIESGPDHYSHAENYCTVASMEIPIKRAGVWGRKKN